MLVELQMLFASLQSGLLQAADPAGVAKVRRKCVSGKPAQQERESCCCVLQIVFLFHQHFHNLFLPFQALKISTENQEDATEFATLLLMTLEKELGGCQSALNFIPELFRGRQTQSMVS